MSDAASHTAKLRERLTTGTEDKLGRALAELFDNPLVTGTIGRAFDARERAAQAQELALSALNIPTAADIERLTRRLRSVSQRLEGIEDGVHRINRALSEGSAERRLAVMEEQLKVLSSKLSAPGRSSAEAAPTRARKAPSAGTSPAPKKASSVSKKTSPAAKKSAAGGAVRPRKASSTASASTASKRPARAPRAKKSA